METPVVAEFSKREGDFDWGVAYHPYPERLFEAAAGTTNRCRSPTTHVLSPRRILRCSTRSCTSPPCIVTSKKLRQAILSEQGFNTHPSRGFRTTAGSMPTRAVCCWASVLCPTPGLRAARRTRVVGLPSHRHTGGSGEDAVCQGNHRRAGLLEDSVHGANRENFGG